MVIPMGGGMGGGPVGPPTSLMIATLPKVKVLLYSILVTAVLRFIGEIYIGDPFGNVLNAIFDLFTPLFGFFLCRSLQDFSRELFLQRLLYLPPLGASKYHAATHVEMRDVKPSTRALFVAEKLKLL